MLKLEEISFGALAFDRISRVKGNITAKLERESGQNSVCVEGTDSTGRSFADWIELSRLELS